MNTPQAGWFPDPYSRHNRRYFDGRSWTAHVANAQGDQGSDPEPLAPAAPVSVAQPAWGHPTTPTPTPPARAAAPQAGQPLRPAPQAFAGPAASAQPAATTGRDIRPVSPDVIIAGIGAVLTLIGVLVLDWFTADGLGGATVGDLSDVAGEADPGLVRISFFQFGWIVSLLAAAFAVGVLVVRKTELRIPAAAACGVCALWTLVSSFTLKSWFSDTVGVDASFAIGFYVAVVGLVALAAAQFVRAD